MKGSATFSCPRRLSRRMRRARANWSAMKPLASGSNASSSEAPTMIPTARTPGPGVLAVGIIVGASEDEAFEPDANGFIALQLARARRILRLNLLGQLKVADPFIPGVSIYPTLD